MELALPHSVTYAVGDDVPVTLVARSLLASERLIHESFRLLEDLEPGLSVSRVAVAVREVSQHSPLRQLLVATLVVTFQEDLERTVPSLLEAITGRDIPPNAEALVTILVVVIALSIIDRAIKAVWPDKETKKLRRDLARQVERLAQLTGKEVQEIERVLEDRFDVTPTRSLLDKARDFVLPAKARNGEILAGDTTIVSREAIQEVPDDIDRAIAEAPVHYERARVAIEVHRADRDENKHGWRAIIPAISERKVRMELAPTIAPSELYGKTLIIGDVLVQEATDAIGAVEPRTYHLLRVHSGSTS